MKTFTSLLIPISLPIPIPIPLSLSLILFCVLINTFAAELRFVANNKKTTTQVCMAAVTDNTEVMINKIRRLSRRGTAPSFCTFVNSIKCNNQFIANFAKTYNAQTVFAYLDQCTNSSNKKTKAK